MTRRTVRVPVANHPAVRRDGTSAQKERHHRNAWTNDVHSSPARGRPPPRALAELRTCADGRRARREESEIQASPPGGTYACVLGTPGCCAIALRLSRQHGAVIGRGCAIGVRGARSTEGASPSIAGSTGVRSNALCVARTSVRDWGARVARHERCTVLEQAVGDRQTHVEKDSEVVPFSRDERGCSHRAGRVLIRTFRRCAVSETATDGCSTR